MEYIPVKTRIMNPPQDDLFAVFDDYLTDIREGDVILVSSKVVAIHEGRCVPAAEFDKAAYIQETAEVVIPRPYWSSPLTITNHMPVGSAGVDQSNSNGYFTLLPKEPFVSAELIHSYICDKHNIEKIGIIITDSRSVLCRYGAIGAAVSWWGLQPLHSRIGETDLFGRKIKHERSNLVDGLAAGATVVMGEVDECTPIVIARNVPSIEFVEGNTRDTLFASFTDDTLRILYERFLT